MKYLAFIIIFFFSFNTKSLLAQPHDYSVFAYRLDNHSPCSNVSNILVGLHSAEEVSNMFSDNLEKLGIEVPEWAVPFDWTKDDDIVRSILQCLRDNNIIEEKCGKNYWEFESFKSTKKCFNKIKKHYEKKDKQRLMLEEKCIRKAKDMKTETAFKMMYYNCMKQNN